MERIVPIFYSLSKSMQSIHKASCGNISTVQSAIIYELSLLSKPSMQMVADAVDMDITTFSRQIRTLEKKELVARTPFEGDRRIHILSLTEKGRQMVDAINDIITAKMESAFATMNDFERETVLRSLQALDGKLQESIGEEKG
ncbi:MarR family winged helix-turn-helix transcriptional regulator [Sporosarcina sp. ACRSM]|uniref:MarR family winged helix-turn-helix transcriptional regulator n=1 Tax=Sporosarcina sp. ACRSM TaxID=2918216 RepID=UPI001EF56D6D|nr:MarR family winged helix-turn-helix transcriptional regulator [Sporosarcina sp. ACRSM]MCG7334482.1 MarR family winged helix-turn-helix transcriptional regulator [Sporosarcina sp. ACRSM]